MEQGQLRSIRSRTPCQLALAGAGLLVSLLSGQPALAQADNAPNVVIKVEVGRSIGTIKPLRGVNGAPDLTFLPAGGEMTRMGPRQNVAKRYREANVNLVRTHDSFGAGDLDPHSGPLPELKTPMGGPPGSRSTIDLSVIFPNLAADASDPKSYNFGPTDKLIEGIHGIGAQVVFRLGRSGQTTALPPTDLAKYGEIIRHVVLHYNKGWSNGYADRVKYWEVWNEPDLGRIFWTGTAEQYHALYAAVAKAVKAADPKALVGGPAIALVNQKSPYREGFLAFVREHKLPLDFFSWHWYAVDDDDPYGFARIGFEMRRLLNQYGFTKTESHLNEWNFDFQKAFSTPEALRAAFVASARIYMQDSPIDIDAFYRADMDLRDKPTKVGYALIATGKMALTPVRLATSGADTNGLAVLAGRSRNGRTIQVLVSNYEISATLRGPRKGPDIMHAPGLFDLDLLPRRSVTYPARDAYTIDLSGLAKGRWKLDHFRIDDKQNFTLIESRTVTAQRAAITGKLAAPMVDLIVLTRQPS